MKSPSPKSIAAAVAIGIGMRFVAGLEPVWWLAWIVPALLLALALRSSASAARWSTGLAALIGVSANLPYYVTVMPAWQAALVLLAQSGLWLLVIMATRRIVLRFGRWWTVLAYPALWVALDLLMAWFTPDGNWGNPGYTQTHFVPMLQIAALFGTSGILFVISLASSALAMAFALPARPLWPAYALTALVLAGSAGFGVVRLQTPQSGQQIVFGLAAIDDAIGMQANPAYAEPIWRQYEQHVASLAGQGAQIIVLPEKIATLPPAAAALIQARFAALAARLHVWITLGVAIDDGSRRTNHAWLLTPQGTVAHDYLKRRMAPAERSDLPGRADALHMVHAQQVGLAICKDMHFADLGRSYGQRGASIMLVPAWDFYRDRDLAAGMTATRGVENGYTVVRSARDGLLTVSDPFGRMLAQKDSAPMPGATLLAKVGVPGQLPTQYTRSGDAPAWLLAMLGIAMLVFSVRKPRQDTRR